MFDNFAIKIYTYHIEKQSEVIMGFMGGVFKILGFEGESKPKVAKKKPKTAAKATYSLKKGDTRPEQIDGISVYYPEKKEQCKEFVVFAKEGKAIIISTEYCTSEDCQGAIDFLNGFVVGANARLIVLNENKLFLILPEGMEVED